LQTHQRTWKIFQRRHVRPCRLDDAVRSSEKSAVKRNNKAVRFVVKASLVAVVGLLAVGPTVTIKVARASSVHTEQPAGGCSQNTATKSLRLLVRDPGASHTISLHGASAQPERPFCKAVTNTRAGRTGSTRRHQPTNTHRAASKSRPQQKHHPLLPHRPLIDTGNVFPYGQCTWWANQRYRQLHGMYVPWKMPANAWQWTARANEFGWHVSQKPRTGAIIDLQPWVQGSQAQGHVAIVERVLGDGRVLASMMNWGWHSRWEVTQWTFSPGPGVTFISS